MGSGLTLDTTNSRSDGPAGHALGSRTGPSFVRTSSTYYVCMQYARVGRAQLTMALRDGPHGASGHACRLEASCLCTPTVLVADGVVVLADEPTVVCLNVPYRPGTNQRSLPHAAELNTCSVRACSRSLSSFTP